MTQQTVEKELRKAFLARSYDLDAGVKRINNLIKQAEYRGAERLAEKIKRDFTGTSGKPKDFHPPATVIDQALTSLKEENGN